MTIYCHKTNERMARALDEAATRDQRRQELDQMEAPPEVAERCQQVDREQHEEPDPEEQLRIAERACPGYIGTRTTHRSRSGEKSGSTRAPWLKRDGKASRG